MSTARQIVSLAKPKKSSILPVDKPLSLLTLQRISESLATQPTPKEPPFRLIHTNAAVLLPLFNVNDNPAILFQVRARRGISHSGEVSFPGGKYDIEDKMLQNTAMRETYEEIGLATSHIGILGSFGPAEQSLAGTLVHPFAGFLSPSPINQPDDHGQGSENTLNVPLPNLDLSTLITNPAEVELLFHLTLEELSDERRLSQHHFRGRPPYWCVNVSDKVPEAHWTTPRTLPTGTPDSKDAVDRGKRLEIWGLTGYYLNLFMRTVGLW